MTEVYAVLKCLKCNSKFKVAQHMAEAGKYLDALPTIKAEKIPDNISTEETKKVKKELTENNKLLNDLNLGMVPGISSFPPPLSQNND